MQSNNSFTLSKESPSEFSCIQARSKPAGKGNDWTEMLDTLASNLL